MNESVFPLHISQALDRLTVPNLPTGFNDRLAARIASGDLPEEVVSDDLALPILRRPVGTSGWRRPRRIVFVAAAFGLATATAAAAGVFGDPVYIPVVSQALAKAQIAELPVAKPAAEKSVKAESTSAKETKIVAKATLSGKDAVLAQIAELRADPAYRNIPRNERQERAKAEIAKLLADGKVQNADVKAAWAQLVTERKAAVQARLDQGLPVTERGITEAKQRAKTLTPEQKEKVRDALKQLTEAQRAELQILRQRRRDATLQERRAVQNEIHAFWQRVRVQSADDNAVSEAP